MEKETKEEIRQFKTVIKNEHLFLRLALKKGSGFFPSLLRISKTYSPADLDFGKAYEELNSVRRFSIRDKVIACGKEIAALLDDVKQAELMKAIDSVIEEHCLGKEWKETFLALTMTGILCPPIFNLYINTENDIINITPSDIYRQADTGAPPKKRWGQLRMSLVLNPDTSKDDINDAWVYIRKAQRAAWLKWKGFNLTANSAKQLEAQLALMQAKHAPIPVDEKLENMSFYESQRIKRGGGMTTKEILKYRKDGGGAEVRKSTKIKQERTDVEAIREIFKPKNKKETQKLVNRLRQEKHRILKR